jgi:uncharacterized membrane protein YgcG
MKKVVSSLLLVIVLLLSLTACAHAEARIDYVSDYAQLLSESERQGLNSLAAQISDQYDFGVFITNIVPKSLDTIIEQQAKTETKKTECHLELVSRSDSVFESLNR